MKRHHGNSYRKAFNWGLVYSFRGLVHYHDGGEHGGTQVGMELEKLLRVLHLDSQISGRERENNERLGLVSPWNLKAHPLVTQLL